MRTNRSLGFGSGTWRTGRVTMTTTSDREQDAADSIVG
jgi:hypothetical protein